MDRNEFFDVEEIDGKGSVAISTAWSSRVAPKARGRRAFGRRGSDAFYNNRTIKNVFPIGGKERKQNTNVDEDQEEATGVETIEQWNMARSPFSDASDVPSPPPRRIKKWRTISGESSATSKPNLPPMIMRSHSVSALMPKRTPSTSSQSISTGSSFSSLSTEGRDNENFNPNFDGHSIMEENTSPKRSAVAEGNKTGRKKSKPTNLSFMQRNNFGALKPSAKESDNTRGNRKGSRKKPARDSFSDIANYAEEVEPAWLTSSTNSLPNNYSECNENRNRGRSYSNDPFSPPPSHFQDDTMESTELLSSPTTSTTSSTRKRGACKSQIFMDDSPVVRSRSRILSPLPDRTPEFPRLMHSVDSKPRTVSKLMNISFCSSKTDHKIIRADVDVTMSDDDVCLSGNSDISFDSEDEIMDTDASFAFHATNHPSSTRSTRVFEPEKASVDDILKYMSSFQDIEFMSKSLKQNFEGQRGCVTWNIAPPVDWLPKRRDTFFHGARKLGFTLRSGGGHVAYIQISKTRGSRLLPLLKATLATYDEGVGRQRLLHSETNNVPKTFVFNSGIKKMDARLSKGLRLTPKE